MKNEDHTDYDWKSSCVYQFILKALKTYKYILLSFIILIILFVVAVSSICCSAILYEFLYNRIIPHSNHSFDVDFNYSQYYKPSKVRIQDSIVPTAQVHFDYLVNELHLSSSQNHNLHIQFELKYTLPYMMVNLRAPVYTIEAQLVSKSGEVVESSIKTFITDWHFMVAGIAKSILLYPLWVTGFVVNGETRTVPCFLDASVNADSDIEWVRFIVHNPEVVISNCVLTTHVKMQGWRSILQEHHLGLGVVFVVLMGTVMMGAALLVIGCLCVMVLRWESPEVTVKKEISQEDKPTNQKVKVKSEPIGYWPVKVEPEDWTMESMSDDSMKKKDSTVRKRRSSFVC